MLPATPRESQPPRGPQSCSPRALGPAEPALRLLSPRRGNEAASPPAPRRRALTSAPQRVDSSGRRHLGHAGRDHVAAGGGPERSVHLTPRPSLACRLKRVPPAGTRQVRDGPPPHLSTAAALGVRAQRAAAVRARLGGPGRQRPLSARPPPGRAAPRACSRDPELRPACARLRAARAGITTSSAFGCENRGCETALVAAGRARERCSVVLQMPELRSPGILARFELGTFLLRYSNTAFVKKVLSCSF